MFIPTAKLNTFSLLEFWSSQWRRSGVIIVNFKQVNVSWVSVNVSCLTVTVSSLSCILNKITKVNNTSSLLIDFSLFKFSSINIWHTGKPGPYKNQKTGTLAGPCKSWKTGTLAGPYKNRKTVTLARPYKNWKTRTLAGPCKNQKTVTLARPYKKWKTGTRDPSWIWKILNLDGDKAQRPVSLPEIKLWQ